MMKTTEKRDKDEWYLELSLIVITLCLACMMWKIPGYKMIVLHLFYMPVVLAGFFLGRYRSGVLATLAVISVSIVTSLNFQDFAAFSTPMIVGLSVTLWAAVLGMLSLMIGTLSDEKSRSLNDLHEAHVGVVEVLARYLQSANPKLKVRSQRVAELSQAVAREMHLNSRECDDIRVAALLYDMENIEITARVIRKAVGDLESQSTMQESSFQGSDLAHSLGSVMSGAFPLLLGQGEGEPLGQASSSRQSPLGAKIICAVRAYDQLMRDADLVDELTGSESRAAIEELRRDPQSDHPEAVLDALELVVASERISDPTMALAT